MIFFFARASSAHANYTKIILRTANVNDNPQYPVLWTSDPTAAVRGATVSILSVKSMGAAEITDLSLPTNDDNQAYIE